MTSRLKFQAQSNANHKGNVLRLDPNDSFSICNPYECSMNIDVGLNFIKENI
jgi:hypothetical protein